MGEARGGIGAQFIARIHHRHPRPAGDGERAVPACQCQREAGRGQARASGEQLVAFVEIEAARADMAARRGQVSGCDLPGFVPRVLLQQHAVSAGGHDGSGRDARALAGGEDIAVRRPGAALTHQRPRAIAACQGIAVHRRKIRRGLGARGGKIGGEDAGVGGFGGDHF